MKSSLLMVAAALTAVTSFAEVPYQLGAAGFTFCKKSLDETLVILQKTDIHNLCVKDFHLKYTATDDEIAAFKAKCAKYGVVPYALGPLYTKNVTELRNYFAFAKRFGAKTIVGVPYEYEADGKARKPSLEQIRELDKLVKQYDIRYAIHNHGPQIGKLFPDVACGWELVKDYDARIGFCMDVGWEYGCNHDPVETIRTYGARLYDMHFKNFEVGKPNGAAIPLPRGKINYVKVMQALADIGYEGVCSLEYEKDFKDNLAAIAECAGYFRGVADAIKAKPRMRPVPSGANTLTAAEKAAGWELLFDGTNLPTDKWVGVKNKCQAFPKVGWFVKDGCLTMRPMNGIHNGKWFPLPPEDQKLAGGGDIVTKTKYRDFEFAFDFRLTEAANSGVKYFFDEKLNKGTCEEYQVLEDGHPDSDKGVNGNRRVAALYDIIPAHAEKIVRPLGAWNSGKVVSKGSHVEHWLNGVKVLEYDRGTPEFKAAVKKSKYATWGVDANGKAQDWGEIPCGRLLLQDHSDSTVSFCNLKVRSL